MKYEYNIINDSKNINNLLFNNKRLKKLKSNITKPKNCKQMFTNITQIIILNNFFIKTKI